jgi:hypothetical protein
MANMPATVGFHVFSIFYPSFFILPSYSFKYDIVKNPPCQYPKTSITANAASLPAVIQPGTETTTPLPCQNSKSPHPSRQQFKESLPEYEPRYE